ncbi:uncharacterized protein PF11_0213 [Trichogramma pretiosum]|uniref:uncharacterized protein PF11_0213 n=1 Tax=Trichogramma pretiosum TaxID=7493 RepID=UPI0006C9D235|nr:uncharacterized protein PF11_0213 [Trichogramma pretiosum]XP_014221203.1 uncharacterized protein PF11_0213 [Trichogramma pretiosum]XP_014221204.1 uncharacterized protein PF11_0213 [Trichogramma pretiosum]
MEQNDEVCDQELAVSSGAASFQQLVQEIVVQNNDQERDIINCQVQNVEIILPNDYVTTQQQCDDKSVSENIVNEKQEAQSVDDKYQYETSEESKIQDFLILSEMNSSQKSYETNHSDTATTTENNVTQKETIKENNDESISDKSTNTVIELSQSKDNQKSDNHDISNSDLPLSNNDQDDAIQDFDETTKSLQEEKISVPVNSTEPNLTANAIDAKMTNNTLAEDGKASVIENHSSNTSEVDSTCLSKTVSINNDAEKVTSNTDDHEMIVETIEITEVTNSDDLSILTQYKSNEHTWKEKTEIEKNQCASQDTCNNESEESLESIKKQISNNKPETFNSDHSPSTKKQEDKDEAMEEDDEDDLELHLSNQSNEKNKSVLQDIFNDWSEENGEEEIQNQDQEDEVEMELQSLLNDGVTSTPIRKVEKKGPSDNIKKSNKSPTKTSVKDSSLPNKVEVDTKMKQTSRPGVKIPGAHLTSQIASSAEVNEVLKERLKEKQKDLQVPKTADIVFVKKITQRLSSHLLAAAATGILSQEPTSLDTSKESETNKSSSDNNDLLAILEGDVDPDWSNLKSTSNTDEVNKVTSTVEVHSSENKLDQVTEREIALKQLRELPKTSCKKNISSVNKKSLTKKSAKSIKTSPGDDESDTINNISSNEEETLSKTKSPKASENEELAVKNDESRSGRKRKLTEKAREFTAKKLRVQKNKDGKKSDSDSTASSDSPKTDPKKKRDSVQSEMKMEITDVSNIEESPENMLQKSADDSNDEEIKKTDSESPEEQGHVETKVKEKQDVKKKIKLVNKNALISKKKNAVKNLVRMKKAVPISKAKVTNQANKPKDKDSTDSSGAVVQIKKPRSEIDRLLQDEGIVNMLYDAKQDTRKRRVPITQSQKKVMDLEKAERELKQRANLVKNAVLKSRGQSDSASSPRARRSLTASATELSAAQNEKKSTQSKASSSFINPGKLKNAAEASRIIRRHSSSSYSSASGASPRVSIDLGQPPNDLLDLESSGITRKASVDSYSDKSDKKSRTRASARISESETKEVSEKTDIHKETTNQPNLNESDSLTHVRKLFKSNNKSSKKFKKTDEDSFDALTKNTDIKLPEDSSTSPAKAIHAVETNTNLPSKSSSRKKRSMVSANDESICEFRNKEVSVKRHGRLVQLILTPCHKNSGIRNALSLEVMKEIQDVLERLKDDNRCSVVVLTSTGTSFCDGLDLSQIIENNETERKLKVTAMATAVKEFIKTLAAFNKPLVAGIQGDAIGLGVTMLPLFDLVIASDKATFETPCSKLGQIAEGLAVLMLSNSFGSLTTNYLLLGGRPLTANEALTAGFVTKCLWPDKFQVEFLPSLKAMSEQSSQAMETTKLLLRKSMREKLDDMLNTEQDLLIKQWCSQEWQDAARIYVKEKGQ